MTSDFKNANTLAHAIKDIAGLELTPRPYNRFEPDDTIWWLVPSVEWPAYKYGKLFFDSRIGKAPKDENGIYSGFYVEKGLGLAVGDLYHQSLIMRDDWLWREFITVLLSDFSTFPPDLILTLVASYIPPEKASFIDTPEGFFAQKESFRGNHVSFSVDAGLKLELINKNLNPSNKEISDHFTQQIIIARNMTDLVLPLSQLPQSDWVWLDFYIGITIPRNSNEINPVHLWKQYLEPWSPWLRKAQV